MRILDWGGFGKFTRSDVSLGPDAQDEVCNTDAHQAVPDSEGLMKECIALMIKGVHATRKEIRYQTDAGLSCVCCLFWGGGSVCVRGQSKRNA